MIIPIVAALLTLLPAVLGGRLSRIGGVRLRHTGVVVTALVVQVAIIEVLPGPRWLLDAAHIGSYVAAAWFVAVNRRIPGLLVIGAGGLANGATIMLNGGTLPATAAAMTRAGQVPSAHFVNSGLVEHPRLWFLGDVFAIPAGWPMANVFSVGDVLIVAGAAYASLRVCGTRWTQPWNPRSAGHSPGRHAAGVPLTPSAAGPPRVVSNVSAQTAPAGSSHGGGAPTRSGRIPGPD